MNLRRKTVGILVASGFEDSQVIKTAQMLRGKGINVRTVAVNGLESVNGLRGSSIEPDASLSGVKINELDAVIIPGGNSTAIFKVFDNVLTLLMEMHSAGKPIGAIGNGTAVLAAAGLTKNMRVTGDEALRNDLEESGANFLDQGLVVDHNLVTAQSNENLIHLVDSINFLLEPSSHMVDEAPTKA